MLGYEAADRATFQKVYFQGKIANLASEEFFEILGRETAERVAGIL